MNTSTSKLHPRLSGSLALAAAIAAGTTLAPTSARASGLDAPVIGHGQSSPSARDAAAVYWNPGQLGFIQKPEVYFGGALVIANIGYQRNRLGTYQYSNGDNILYTKGAVDSQPLAIDPNKTGLAEPVSTTPVAASGNLFVAVPVIKDRFVLGGGFFVPTAALLDLPLDGPQKWQVQGAMILAAQATLSAAVKATDWFSLGAGFSYVGGFAELSKVQDFAATDEFKNGLSELGIQNDFGPNAPSEVRELALFSSPLSLKRAWAHWFTFNVGVAFQPTKKFGINLAYQHSTSLKFKGEVAIDMSDQFFGSSGVMGKGIELNGGVMFPPVVRGDATLGLLLPKRLTLGASYDFNERWRLDGFVQVSFYGEVKSFDVDVTSEDLVQPALGLTNHALISLPRNWNHTVWVEASPRMRITKRLVGSVSLGYQSPASPDETIDMTSPDGHRLLGAGGLAFHLNEKWSFYGDARFQGIIPREVTTSNFDIANGTYKLFIATLGLHARRRF
ncbi:MAG: outer membrane protein transport protein [Nannocystaceae bacterium]|nr:outer membrane protein transport protein [Myxococcales bacterium]